MVKFTDYMVAMTALLLGIHALDQESAEKIKQELVNAKIIPEGMSYFYTVHSYTSILI